LFDFVDLIVFTTQRLESINTTQDELYNTVIPKLGCSDKF